MYNGKYIPETLTKNAHIAEETASSQFSIVYKSAL